jgi:hypothetical protein
LDHAVTPEAPENPQLLSPWRNYLHEVGLGFCSLLVFSTFGIIAAAAGG